VRYGLHRQLTDLGCHCIVVAPALIPRRPGDRVKTDRRDATALATLHRAGELTPVWVPDATHEAMRDLVRARATAARALTKARQQLQAFLLRHRRVHAGRAWTRAHRRWLADLRFDHPAQQIVLQDYVSAGEDAAARVARLMGQIAELVPAWSMATVVDPLQAMRGISLLAAVTSVAEVGDFRRFVNPRQLMAYVGLVPSESSSGGRTRRGGSTKAGNHHARRVLIEDAWTYRFAARLSRGLHARNAEQPKEVRAILPGRRSCACAADTGVSPPAASPRSWSPPRSPARWSGSSGRSPVGCNQNRPPEPTTPPCRQRRPQHDHRQLRQWPWSEAGRGGEPSV
jgi:transposase